MIDTGNAVALLATLVGIDTQNPPGHEAEAAAFISAALAAIGMTVETDAYAPGRVNVVGRLVNGPGPVFAFNTHIDVVPVGAGWTSDPLTLRERDGRLYGRGACDAKGSLAAMIAACAALAADRASWSGTLLAVFVADEEVASDGAKRYAANRPAIDYAVIGEPTGNSVVSAHKGSLRPLVSVRGLTAHSGTPQLGRNAVFHAARLLARFETYAQTLARRTHPLCGHASLTVTRIEGGHADNVIPEGCTFLLDRRMVPGESEADARAGIEAILSEAAADGIEASIAEWRPTTGGATETAGDDPLVIAALAASARHGGNGERTFGFMGGCDLVHFRTTGASGVVIGPGSLDVAHKPDEFVPIEELQAAVQLHAELARAMLKA